MVAGRPPQPIISMVAGEASGDYLGAGLISALKERLPGVRFVGIGGPKMESLGMESWHPMERLAVRGYVEVLKHYAGITAIRRDVLQRVAQLRPAAFVGIDAPDFNLKLERGLRDRGIRTIHYASPSIWAWRGGRIRGIAKSVDHMLVLFPFEESIYENAGIPATYVGHPLADVIPMEDQTMLAREQLQIAPLHPVVTLMPGSRQSELAYMADTFVQTCMRIHAARPDCRFLVPLVSRETRSQFEKAVYAAGAQDLPIRILFGHSRTAIAASNAVLVASGTATLEVALYRKPMVIAYRMAPGTWRLMSRMRYQEWVGLPNIVAGKFIVPEILQDDATAENLAQALLNQLSDKQVGSRLNREFEGIHAKLRRNASSRAAEAVVTCMN